MRDPLGKLMGSWSEELNIYSILLRMGIILVLSAVIGCERASKRHSAGLRTFILVSLSSSMTMMLDIFLAEKTEINFYAISGASVIAFATIAVRSLLISSRSQIKGLTTSVALCASGTLGLTVGAGLYTVTIIGFVLLMCCLSFATKLELYLKNRSNHFEIHLELKDSKYLKNFVSTIRKLGLRIDDIEFNQAYSGSGLSVYTIAISISSEELKKYKTHTEIIEALKSLDYIYYVEEMLI